ncbi:MAG: hypothetical protein JO117_01270, partial [Verrucomicrobia bacterium]|nr:hypothetical protein [Verrucomicrobiota bacterium]
REEPLPLVGSGVRRAYLKEVTEHNVADHVSDPAKHQAPGDPNKDEDTGKPGGHAKG